MHYLPITKTARIETAGEIHAKIKDIWIVIHGYGQLVNYFIKHFECLIDENTLVIAPEGLSRFYADGFFGRVGASWMTKEDRLIEIEDQQNYLNQVVSHFLSLCPNANLHLLGFSQGVATAWRWAATTPYPLASFTIWTGQIPPNEFSDTLTTKLEKLPIFHVAATADEFVSMPQFEAQFSILQTQFPQSQMLTFEGKHTLDSTTLLKIKELVNKIH